MAPNSEQTQSRMQDEPVLPRWLNTTELNSNAQEIEDLVSLPQVRSTEIAARHPSHPRGNTTPLTLSTIES